MEQSIKVAGDRVGDKIQGGTGVQKGRHKNIIQGGSIDNISHCKNNTMW